MDEEIIKRKIKICYVASADITLRFILLNQMKFLVGQGYDVNAVCAPGKWVKDVESAGIKVKTIKIKRKISPLSDVPVFFRMYFYFKREKFHIVHTHTLKPEFYGQIAARLAGVPIIINTMFGLDFTRGDPFLRKFFFILLEKIAAKCSTTIFSINRECIDFFKNIKFRIGGIKFLGYSFDVKRFNPAKFPKEFVARKKEEIGINPSKKIVGIVARLVVAKGYLDLFAAFKIVLEKFPNTMILVVGQLEPEKKDAINPAIVKKYDIQENVLFLGERKDIDQIYPLMDVFVLPSHREGVGTAILEASAMERAVIVANVGGCPEAVEDKKTGLLVPPKEPEELARAIIYLLSNPQIAEKMGKEGRKKVLAEFDEKLVFERLQTEYLKLTKEKIGLKYKICCVVSVDITLKFMLLNQLKFLQKAGYDVFAICSPGKWVEDIRRQGIKVKTMHITRKMSPVADLVFFWKMFFYFKKEKFDIVHTHTPKPEVYGQIAAKLAGVPIIVDTLHGFDFPAGASPLAGKVFFFLQKISAKCSDCIFSISNAIIDITSERKICNPHLLKYLGRDIDAERFNPKRFSDGFILENRKKLGIGSEKKVIGIIARLVVEKGYLDLFEAMKDVIVKFPDALLLIVGQEEPEKKDTVKMSIVKEYGIENNVIFLGERADTDELYILMDIFVLPTHREGLGAALLEASAMEKPVIATFVGGCPEAVDDGKTGILVPVKNSKKLAGAIIYLLENPAKTKQMGFLGRQKILKEFNEKLIFNILGTEYQRLINKKIIC